MIAFPQRSCLVVIALALLAACGYVQAEPKKPDSGAQQALRKAQAMLQQLAEEKGHLEEERKKLEAQVRELEPKAGKVPILEAQLENQRKSLESSQQHNLQLTDRINSDVDRMRRFGVKHKGALALLEKTRQDNQRLVSAVKERTDWIGRCTANNKKLYDSTSDLLDKYANKGFWDTLSQSEALTQLGSVKLENEIQDYQFKLEDLLVTPYQEPEGAPVDGGQPDVATGTADQGQATDEDEDFEAEPAPAGEALREPPAAPAETTQGGRAEASKGGKKQGQ